MALQASMQRRARQMWNGGLKRVEAIIEWQQRVPAKGDNHGLFFKGKNCRMWVLRTCRKVGQRSSFPPLGDRLLIDPIALRKCPQALLTILYCSTDCLCRCGAAV